MPAPDIVKQLVERFDRNLRDYTASEYKEERLRIEFVNPFFKALGWDVDNESGYAEAYKDVVHEDTLKIGGKSRAPDYSFRIGGVRKFFVETKKPSVDIRGGVDPAYQLRRYAWSAKLPLSILTDFEEFAIYDTRIKPVKTDKSAVARIGYIRYNEYVERWDEIAGVFSREAVLKGSFDQYAETTKNKRGTEEVGEAFLEEIERWRELLAKNIALRNPDLTQRELNFAVQRTIDRIVFLRICEDRGIEPYYKLGGIAEKKNVYEWLLKDFLTADARYNSGLFHFSKEKGRYGYPDELTPHIQVDDKPLKDIIKHLYYPDSPYEFSVLPADILGQVYERFLGKVIVLDKRHRASIEEKPEVRKAGGVYYTPTYVVDYIVENTIGKLVEGKDWKKVREMRFLDPACGSGSFLIGAYEYLIDWHLKHYLETDPESHARGRPPRLYRDSKGEWRLTTQERKRILLDNIYGVDIDRQAVEVTKLSLLLKVLEGESAQTLESQLAMFQERALPDLANNIKCGNSLIGPEIYDGQLFDEEAMFRLNAFDWQRAFSKVFKDGGFDAVIGNPPYGADLSPEEQKFLLSKYTTACTDSYVLFMEKTADLVRPNGRVGMIVPSGWVSAPSTERLRVLFANRFQPLTFVTMPYDVFGAYIDTTIYIARKLSEIRDARIVVNEDVDLIVFPVRHKVRSVEEFTHFYKEGDATSWYRRPQMEFLITTGRYESTTIEKLSETGVVLSDVADVQRGVTPYNTKPSPTMPNARPAFLGTVRRYHFERGQEVYIRYDETLAEYKPARYFEGPRLLLRELISRRFELQAVYVEESFVTNKSIQSILQTDDKYTLFFLLGILNSKLLSWYFLKVSSVGRRDDFPKIVLKHSRSLPVVNIEQAGDLPAQIALLSQSMMDLDRKKSFMTTSYDLEMIDRQIHTTDRQIDRLVYELYGLTDEEIAVVEREAGVPTLAD